ncbi:LysM peptidoglycan-binding domain-containing protein [Saccharicrinis sp. 156]|uniref:LysM peptidoglycan-binding domain-containing protein n=1 Tax=Saccharicrinis sp. 156 TaxID=3417574 RepID=UPI003D334C1C
MIRKSIISCLILVACFHTSPHILAQAVGKEGVADKVIVDGKTYYLHIVKKGEGFYGIAKRYGVSQKEIHEANPGSIFGLNPGDILHIPVIGGRNSNTEEIKELGEFIYHTIEKGQTLYFLSKKYNVSIDEIKKYNVGAEGNLLIGTIFKIPVSNSKAEKDDPGATYVYHVVKPKETLYAISINYNTKVDTIIKYNQALENGILAVGSSIRIPKVESALLTEATKYDAVQTPMEDKQYVYHKIKKGETIYSVSKKYNVSQQDLARTNPELNPDGLPLGYVVRIPKAKVRKPQMNSNNQKDDFKVHSVRRRETIYSISRKYGVQITDIEQANPTLILTNIRKGMKIKIPTLDYLARKREENKMEELVVEEKITEDFDTISVDCAGYNYYKNKEVLKVALLLPFDIEATRKANIITKIEEDEEIEIEREDPVLSPRSRTFVEFYEGALLAVDSLKKQGVNLQLYAFDTAPDTSKVRQILARPELRAMDLIIGPAYTSNLKLVSDFSLKHKIKMVYPLSSINPLLNENPYLFQVNTPDSLFYDKYSDYIVNQRENARIVVLKSALPSADENKLAAWIKNKLYLKYLPRGMQPDFIEIAFSEQDVQGVEAMLSHDKVNVVVIPSPDEADVSKIITTLHGVSQSTDVQVKLIGFGSWLRFQTIDAEEIHDLDTQILTPYVLDHQNGMVQDFTLKYRTWYHTEPFAVSPYFIRSGRNVNYSRYGIWGFDVMYYFMGAQVRYGHQFEHCISNYSAEQVQFNFNFKRHVNWGGFYNDGLYVIGFGPSLDIYRKPLR